MPVSWLLMALELIPRKPRLSNYHSPGLEGFWGGNTKTCCFSVPELGITCPLLHSPGQGSSLHTAPHTACAASHFPA